MTRVLHPLQALLNRAAESLTAHTPRKKESAPSSVAGSSAYAGIIFSGNPHETVPRRLLLDNRLSPLERNTWQVFRLLINDDSITAFPTYDQLRPYLGLQPGTPASRETIAKTLVTLRLTRWLSLGRRMRCELNGQVKGNIYLLHDEPVTPAEAVALDKDYMKLLVHSLKHANKTVRTVAELVWKEFAADPHVGAYLPTRLEVMEHRINDQSWANSATITPQTPQEFGIRTPASSTEFGQSSDAELGKKTHFEENFDPSSESELSRKTRSSDSVRMPNSYSTYTNTNTNVCIKDVHTAHEGIGDAADPLAAQRHLSPEQKTLALAAMRQVPASQQAAVVEQWERRCNSGTVLNPLAYLMGCIQRAVSGEFNSDWTPKAPPANVSHPPTRPKPSIPTQAPEQRVRSPEALRLGQRQLQAVMEMLNLRKPNP